ncbi:hypothetical protein HDR58_10660 [bacterium]|nr:hypothetical protein [bacterium]
MHIQRIYANQFTNYQKLPVVNNQTNSISNNNTNAVQNSKIPCTFKYNANIHFGEFFDPNRTVPHIDYEEYITMSDNTKRRFRKRYATFFKNKQFKKEEMIDNRFLSMPLQSETLMDEFLKTSKIYSKYKDNPIICLGRSPKWFLNAALWMKDGIDDYKFVAFSKNWYAPDIFTREISRKDKLAPTPKEEAAYRKYLKRIKADPQTIVDHMKETGKKTVITDYIDTGKGVTSFLDVMSKYAEDLGILEEFCNSIHIVGIGSRKYTEERLKLDYEPTPKVTMPERMIPYEKQGLWTYKITQEFHDMDYSMFKEMLVNQNTNECRSTYYPHEAWTIYKPDHIKTGLIKDFDKAKKLVKQLRDSHEKTLSSFTPAMFDFRNLLNFRILDALNTRNLLKAIHKSKV